MYAIRSYYAVNAAIQIASADGQGADGFAVIGFGDGNEAGFLGMSGLLPELKTHLQRRFHGGRAVVGEKNFGQAFGSHGAEAFGQ